MAAFERISCGIEGLDRTFDNIRLGDNVVWQLTSLDDFPAIVDPFVRQTVADGRPLIYIRFASHAPLVQPQPGVSIHTLNPHKGFEAFTVEVRSLITSYGLGACYVFDCLSELQAAWSADLMMGNFFRVTCPYLFELDTVAYFPIIRGMHSFRTIARIRDTTQLLVDVYPNKAKKGNLYVHPLKVWNRYSETMFLAHSYDPATGKVAALTDGFEASRFYATANAEANAAPDRNTDSWDRFFAAAQQDYARGELDEATCTKMCNMMMSKDPKMRSMVRRYFEPADYFEVRNHMVGTGIIGGKACGMLVARKIVERELPQHQSLLEPHDSYYLGSDIFYSYLVESDLWKLRIEQRSEEGFIEAAPALREGLLHGTFPDDIREGLARMLEYYGNTPIIVRSSSFLEDGYDNAFAGKYESVFCANTGPLEERLEALEDAIRLVYASTMDPSALEYRRANGLDKREEQMAILVQRVSGSRHEGKLFFPTAAGVGYSRSTYRWSQDLDPEAGMLRLVAGLGTRAVDRTQNDYPRIVSLDRPLARTTQSWAERHRYSQHAADVLDLEAGAVAERDVQQLADILSPGARAAVFEHDREAETLLRERGHRRAVLFASCQGLAENSRFTSLMSDILSTLERCYEHPVDIEYAVNVGPDGQFVVNLLQCRPLRVLDASTAVVVPALPREDTYFRIEGSAMGKSRITPIDVVVVVDPLRYYRCPHAQKPTVAHMVGMVNARFKGTKKNCLLMVPGRIGTSSPELGVPVSFADVSGLAGICEVASSEAGYSPELSYGSHLFQDLVEADIYYGALLEDEKRVYYDPGFAERFHDVSDEILPDAPEELRGIVRVLETGADDGAGLGDGEGSGRLVLWHDLNTSTSVCGIER